MTNSDNYNIFAESLENVIIFSSEDSFVDEDLPDENFSLDPYLASGWSRSFPDNQGVKQVLTYVKFPMNEIPQSSFGTSVIIDNAKLQIHNQQPWYEQADSFLITVYHCFENSWLEENITWNNRLCKESKQKDTVSPSIIINKENKSTPYSWDVTEIIKIARNQNLSDVTFIVSALPYNSNIIDIPNSMDRTKINPGLIWLWPSEKKEIVADRIPQLDVQYIIKEQSLDFYEWLTISLVVIAVPSSIILPIQYVRKRFPFRRFVRRRRGGRRTSLSFV